MSTAARPADEAEFAAYRARLIPRPGRLAPWIWSFAIPFRPEVPYTFAYVVRGTDGSAHIIDPGFDTPSNRELLTRNLAFAGLTLSDVATVTATHFHHDHLGLAAWLAEISGASVHLHRHEQTAIAQGSADSRYSTDIDEAGNRWGVPADARPRLQLQHPVPPPVSLPRDVVLLDDADTVPVPGRDIQVVHTPGHTKGHICLAAPQANIVFTGDHVFPRANPGIARGGFAADDDPIRDYLRSLEAMAPFADAQVAPGHAYRFTGLESRRKEIATHVLTRAQEAAATISADPDASVWTIAESMTWKGGSLDLLSGSSLQSALLQTAYYSTFVRTGGDTTRS